MATVMLRAKLAAHATCCQNSGLPNEAINQCNCHLFLKGNQQAFKRGQETLRVRYFGKEQKLSFKIPCRAFWEGATERVAVQGILGRSYREGGCDASQW